MKNPQKFFALVIGIVVVLAVGGWLYFQFNTSIFPSNPVERDWQTYSNNQFGFELKYPTILTASELQESIAFANPSAINSQGSGIAFSVVGGDIGD